MEQIQVGDSKCGGGISRKDAVVSVGGATTSRFDTLPEDCISMVIYHTTPRDACVVASVSKTVKSAAESDLVWEKFLPPESSSLVPRSSKKETYLSLADDPVLIDEGKKSFWLEKGSGKKCYMLSAMDLKITWSDSPAYWQWVTVPESKFEKVAELCNVCWFEIRGKISVRMLSKGTHYSVYLVFKRVSSRSYGFDHTPIEAEVGFAGKEASKTFVFLEPGDKDPRSGYGYSGVSLAAVSRAFRTRRPWMRFPREEVEGERESGGNVEEPKERGDKWSEVKLGSFYTNDGGCDDDDEIEIAILETQMGQWKSGLVFQGIEIRPLKEEVTK